MRRRKQTRLIKKKIYHLMYVDGIKLFVKNEKIENLNTDSENIQP